MKHHFLGAMILSLSALYAVAATAAPRKTYTHLPYVNEASMEQWVDSIFERMTPDQRIGQLFMPVCEPSMSAAQKKIYLSYVVDGMIGGMLFSSGDPLVQAQATNYIQALATYPLLISLDGEWGLSMRLKGTTRFPRNMAAGAADSDELMYAYGEEVARQCRLMGIHINFAPVLDVNSNPNNPVIGTRSLGSNPERVTHAAIAYAKGLEHGGVLSVAKHFPGHGDTKGDSHHTLPVVYGSRTRLDAVELYPFTHYINEGLSGVMSGHLNVPALDKSKQPSSLSKKVVTDLLVGELGFEGLRVTDALAMKGAASKQSVCVAALLAGNDMLLSMPKPVTELEAVKQAVASGVLKRNDMDERCRKVLRLKYRLGLSEYVPIDTEELMQRLATPEAEELALEMNQRAVTLLKNKDVLLPMRPTTSARRLGLITLGASMETLADELSERFDLKHATLSTKADAATIQRACRAMSNYDTVMIAIASTRALVPSAVMKMAKSKHLILSLFTTPYRLTKLKAAEQQASATIIAYEDTPLAARAVARFMAGEAEASGRLTVDLPGLYKEGDGLMTSVAQVPTIEAKMHNGRSPFRKVDSLVIEGLKKGAYPGCQLAVMHSGKMIYQKSFGNFSTTDHHPVENSDLFDIASVTKALATLPVLMWLYDQGKFRLDAPIEAYLPELISSQVGKVIVRDMLFHESGLVPFIPFQYRMIDEESYEGKIYSARRSKIYRVPLDGRVYGRTDYHFRPEIASRKGGADYPFRISDSLHIAASFRDTIFCTVRDSELLSKKYRYSDLNFMLLAWMAERLGGAPLDQLYRRHIIDPMGLERVCFLPLAHFDKREIVPSQIDDFWRMAELWGEVNDETAACLGGVAGHAGLFATAGELAQVAQMILDNGNYNGKQILTKSTCHLFTTTHSYRSRRGLGFDRRDPKRGDNDYNLPPEASFNSYGHTGFTGTCFWVDPDKELVYVFLSNRTYPTRANRELIKLNTRTNIHSELYRALPLL